MVALADFFNWVVAPYFDSKASSLAILAWFAVDQLVAETLDDATQQALIEDFIQKVGAGS